MNLTTKKYGLLLMLLMPLVLQAQTNHFQLIWDKNQEPDMYVYRIFRGNSENTLQQIDSVYFPDTTFNDFSIKKGHLYYYAIKAVDLALNASEFSDVVSAAIPVISGLPSQMECPPDTTIQFVLDNHVSDPDQEAQLIQWAFTGYNQLLVNFDQTSRILTITTPSNWTGQDRLDLQATDSDGFYDRTTIYFIAKVGDSAPQFSTIPEQSTLEDTAFEIHLLQFVQDADTPADQLKFTVSQAGHLILNLKDSILTVTPEPNWYGRSSIEVRVVDDAGLADSSRIDVVVKSVNDPPVISPFPNFRLKQDTTISLSLNNYVYDVDDNKENLSWTFANHPHLDLNYDQNNQILTITTPEDWSGFEYIQAKVQDPADDFAIDTLIVQVLAVAKAPVIVNFPEIVFNEDETYTIDLTKYVEDPDTPIQNLFWEAYDYQNLQVEINYSTKEMRVGADKDWNGTEQFWLKVSDTDLQADSILVSVQVLPVNDPPYFSNVPIINLSNINPRTINFSPFINDIDDSNNELYLRALPTDSIQVSIDGHLVQFKASEDWFGIETVSLVVQDQAGAADTTGVLVFKQNFMRAPRIVGLDSIHIREDGQRNLKLTNKVTDPDNNTDQITWEISGGENITIQFNPDSQEVTFVPKPDWWGDEDIILKATDPEGNFDFDTLEVYVQGVNDPPQLKKIPNQTMLAGTYYTFDLKEYLYDADGYDDLAKIELLNDPNSYIGYYLTENGFRVTFFAPQGFHGNETFMLRVADRAGETAISIFVINVLANTVKSGIHVNPFGSGTIMNFNWTSRMPTKDHIEYSLDYSFDQTSEQEQEFSTEHSFTLKNLEPNQTYHFRIVSLDQSGNVVINPDSVFSTGVQVEGINVFPIPFRIGDAESGDGIYFTNLGSSATIMIFNLLGELVFKQEVHSPVFRWDIKNQAQKEVHSGLYIYHVKTEHKTYRGKLIIIR